MTIPLLIQAESRAVPLADKSVNMICTSPPYFSLRDYAVAGQIGLERLHDCSGWATGVSCGACYICAMRAVARECWRVLRDDGTLWLNVGDSYNAAGREGHGTRIGYKQGTNRASATGQETKRPTAPGLKPKDLCGIPWRLALALQADGWTLRSEIIWHKPNPMPESVTDRPTRSHEQVFLFSKGERYFYDAEAIRAPSVIDSSGTGYHRQRRLSDGHQRTRPQEANRIAYGDLERRPGILCPETGRNARSVWEIATEPFSGAHFATYPTALVRRCILAGTSAHGVCSACKAPWVREMTLVSQRATRPGNAIKYDASRNDHGRNDRIERAFATTGWHATCACQAPLTRATVFDPFCGSGTTLQVARELGRASIGTDLSYPYLHDIARQRLGFADLDAWAGKAPVPRAASYAELPLFAGS